jgi:hypothetical protein
MKLYHRFSAEPLLELRLDYGSADGRTVKDRPYLWFQTLEEGRLRKRIKVINLPVDQAMGFVQVYLDRFLAISGQPDARQQMHDFFKLFEFDVRANKGRGPRRVASAPAPEPEPPHAPAPESGVRQLVRKLSFWRKGVA